MTTLGSRHFTIFLIVFGVKWKILDGSCVLPNVNIQEGLLEVSLSGSFVSTVIPDANQSNEAIRTSQNDLYNNGTSISLTCMDPLFELDGSESSTCVNGSWRPELPLCKRTCGKGSNPRSGYIHHECTHVGCVGYYHCNEGFEIQREGTITCHDNGTWISDNDQAPYCLGVICNPPPLSPDINATFSQPALPGGTGYLFNTTVTYACTDGGGGLGAQMYGDEVRKCQQNHQWSGSTPYCVKLPLQGIYTTVSKPITINSTGNTLLSTVPVTMPTLGNQTNLASTTKNADVITVTSSSPGDTSPSDNVAVYGTSCKKDKSPENGSVYSNGTTLVYICKQGFLLYGSSVRHCLMNGSWTDGIPQCLVAPSTTASSPGIHAIHHYHWKQILHINTRWSGSYQYRGRSYNLRMELGRQTFGGYVTGNITADKARLRVKGYQSKNGDLIFNMTELTVSCPHFSTTSWHMRGQLIKDHCTWKYVGNLYSTAKGFEVFSLHSVDESWRLDHCMHIKGINQAMAVGISIAFIIIIVVGVVVFYYTRKAGLRTMTGHRTLTSFENPVYEYEHGTLRVK